MRLTISAKPKASRPSKVILPSWLSVLGRKKPELPSLIVLTGRSDESDYCNSAPNVAADKPRAAKRRSRQSRLYPLDGMSQTSNSMLRGSQG
jgi:hypothetical protein